MLKCWLIGYWLLSPPTNYHQQRSPRLSGPSLFNNQHLAIINNYDNDGRHDRDAYRVRGIQPGQLEIAETNMGNAINFRKCFFIPI